MYCIFPIDIAIEATAHRPRDAARLRAALADAEGAGLDEAEQQLPTLRGTNRPSNQSLIT